MITPAQQYLTWRALGAPAILLSTAMQGTFRGLKDAKTLLYAIGMLMRFEDLSTISYHSNAQTCLN